MAAPGRFVYIPPIEYAMRIYAAHFQETEAENTIQSAFAILVPKILDRCQEFMQTVVNSIIDRGHKAPETHVEYAVLFRELSSLAAVFVGPPGNIYCGPFAKQYESVCSMIVSLTQIMN